MGLGYAKADGRDDGSRVPQAGPRSNGLAQRTGTLSAGSSARYAAGGGPSGLREQVIDMVRREAVVGQLEREPHRARDLEHGGEADTQDRGMAGRDARPLGRDQRGRQDERRDFLRRRLGGMTL